MEEKVIISAQVASFLLKHGATITKIKADRTNPVKSVFVFLMNEKFYDGLKKYSEYIGNKKER